MSEITPEILFAAELVWQLRLTIDHGAGRHERACPIMPRKCLVCAVEHVFGPTTDREPLARLPSSA